MVDSPSMTCEQCGGKLVSFKENSACGSRCLVCGWSLVTTDIPGIKVDDMDYEIFCFGDCRDKAHVMAVSKASGIGFLKSRENLSQGEFVVLRGKSLDVLRVLDELIVAGLKCGVKPNLIWGGQ